MRFQGEKCVLNMASYFNRDDVRLNGTFWVRRSEGERYRQPWLRFTHTLSEPEYEQLRDWLQAVVNDDAPEPLRLSGIVPQIHQVQSVNPDEISLDLWYNASSEPVWWAWDLTTPLHIRLDVPRTEFRHLITVFEKVEWSFY